MTSLRSSFGQLQSSFESVINSLDSQSFNLNQARSRIEDADFAAETLNLTKNQILRDASVSLLAQANISPRQALQLLEDLG